MKKKSTFLKFKKWAKKILTFFYMELLYPLISIYLLVTVAVNIVYQPNLNETINDLLEEEITVCDIIYETHYYHINKLLILDEFGRKVIVVYSAGTINDQITIGTTVKGKIINVPDDIEYFILWIENGEFTQQNSK